MNIAELAKTCVKPEIYTPSTSKMWTDPHISKKLLEVHLNPEMDLASRKPSSISKTIEWILSQTDSSHQKILDLGCGPGLYTEAMAKKGHDVTGVDISGNSINYAVQSANDKNLRIKYLNQDYLKLELEDNTYDLITMIYTDFGVLLPEEQNVLLSKAYALLKSGGVFIFDVVNDKEINGKITQKSWDCKESGFWRDSPYICLSDSFYYENEKVILSQHFVITECGDHDIYRFWMHLFSHDGLLNLLSHHGFNDSLFSEEVLPTGNCWNGDNITFTAARK